MRQVCVQIEDREIFLSLERLHPWVQKCLIEAIKESKGSGKVSGIRSGEDEYVGVIVEEYSESIGYYKTTVKKIVSFFTYQK